MNITYKKERIWELDFFRGIALVFMVYFHVIYDLREFFYYPVSYASGINFYVGKASALLFMLISGISCSLSKNNINRGLKVLGAALIITTATHLYNPDYGVKFGILHFLGVSMLLYPLFGKINKYILIVLGTAIILLGSHLSKVTLTVDYLFPIGLTSSSFISSDYYPLTPWFGVFLYGIALEKLLYAKKQSLFAINLEDNIVSKAGRKTFLLYLAHQPLIMFILVLLNFLISKF
jgi:uncharacterized membrane protein